MAQNCLYIGTVLPFRRKSISVILGTVKTLHSSRSGLEWLFSISVKVVVSILFQKARRVLNNERGEANYFSTVVFIIGIDEGEILLDGTSVLKKPMACKRKMAYVPDNPQLDEYMTGLQYLNFICDIYEVPSKILPADCFLLRSLFCWWF